MSSRISRSAFSIFIALGAGFVSARVAAANEPTVTYSVAPDKLVAKHPFRVTYEVKWEGGAEVLGVLPAEPEAIGWGTGRLVEATTGAESGAEALRYTVEYMPDRAGEFEVPALALSYVLEPPLEERPKVVADASAAAAPAKPKVEPKSLQAPGFSVKIGRNVNVGLILAAGGGAVMLGVLVSGVLLMRRRRSAAVGAPKQGTTVQALLNLARQHRLDGKFYEYYRELARATQLLAPSIAAKKLRETLEHHAQQVGYGALRPTEDELEGAMRDLDRVMREDTKRED